MHCCSASCLSALYHRPPTLCFALLLYASPSRSWSNPLLSLSLLIVALLFLCITSPYRTPPCPRFLRRSIAIQLKAFPMLICAFLVIAFPLHRCSFQLLAVSVLTLPRCSLPLHGKSHHCRNFSYPLLALPSHFNSIPRLFCSTQSAALPFNSMSYLRYAVTMLICLYYATASQCVSMPLPSLSVPLPNSAAHAFPMLICAIPWRIYCSHHLSATYLFISFASLLPTSQVFAVTLHTLRIHCRAMRCRCLSFPCFSPAPHRHSLLFLCRAIRIHSELFHSISSAFDSPAFRSWLHRSPAVNCFSQHIPRRHVISMPFRYCSILFRRRLIPFNF